MKELRDRSGRTAIATSVLAVIIVVVVVVAGVGYYFLAVSPSTSSSTTTFTQSSSSSAVTTSTASTSTSSTADQQAADQALYQAALKNGETTLVVYSSLADNQFPVVANNFNMLYPGIKLQYTDTPPPTAISLISSELQAQGHSADIVQVSYSTIYTLYKNGYLQTYVSPYAKTFPSNALDPLNATTPTYSLPAAFIYNTNLVKTPPTTLSQVASSTYKGSMLMLDPTSGTSSTSFFGSLATSSMGNATVTSFLQQLAANVKPTFTADQGGIPAAIASGQYAIGLPGLLTDAIPLIDQGAPIRILNITGLPILVTYTNTALIKGALHPNAAKLFIDYLSSPQGQAVIGAINIRFPVNSNVVTTYTLAAAIKKYAPGQSTLQYPTLTYLQNSAAYVAQYKRIFGSG